MTTRYPNGIIRCARCEKAQGIFSSQTKGDDLCDWHRGYEAGFLKAADIFGQEQVDQ